MSNQLLLRRKAMMVSHPDYLRFTAIEDSSSVTLSKVSTPTNHPTEYALNGGVFLDYTFGDSISLNRSQFVEFRRKEGYESSQFSTAPNAYYKFTITGKINVTGNIVSLLTPTLRTTTIYGYSFNYSIPYQQGLYAVLTLPDTLEKIYDRVFEGCSGFKGDLILHNNIKSIESRAFYNCTGFNGVLRLPSGLTSIGKHCFYGCSGLVGDIIIPDTITTIPEALFQGCSGFNGNLTLPSSLTTIGPAAFDGCRNLKGSVVFPDTITYIGEYVFRNCNSISNFVSLATTPPKGLNNYTFPGSKKIYVPYSADHSILNAYKAASGWSSFASNIYELDENGEIPV